MDMLNITQMGLPEASVALMPFVLEMLRGAYYMKNIGK